MANHLPSFIHFGRAVCGDLAQAERREWWLADGFGGYSSGTLSQSLTRRYHGLLVSADPHSLARHLLFAKAEVTLIDGDLRYPLFTNRWCSGAIEPTGHLHIESFRLDGSMPVWRYAVGDIILEQRIWFEPGSRDLYLAWGLLQPLNRPIELDIALLCNDRDHHGQTRQDNLPNLSAEVICDRSDKINCELLCLISAGKPRLHFITDNGQFRTDNQWYRDFLLPVALERGLPDRDDHFCAGHLRLRLYNGSLSGFVASTNEIHSRPYFAEALRRSQSSEVQRIIRAELHTQCHSHAPDWIRQLVLDSDRFLIRLPRARPDSQASEPINHATSTHRRKPPSSAKQFEQIELADGIAIIAGYPWFGDWGRDTFIALPGLTLITGRYQVARRILLGYGQHIKDGLIPNTFPEDGSPALYNTADAALWYVEAWRCYAETIDDHEAVRQAFPQIASIIAGYMRGTHHGIAMDSKDGLIRAGEPALQVTWMDARVEGVPVTPRTGKPVEINALWYNALCVAADFATRLGEDPARYAELALQARLGFQRFAKPDGTLYDVLDSPQGDDASVRPNQILAVSLHHSPLEHNAQVAVVTKVARHLLTSYGLRTLAADEPDYHPCYTGKVDQRDAAYHQGPAWAWLLGHYALAEYRVTGDAARAQARLEPLRDHLQDAGLGSISELFDAAPPHLPRGAPCQAWSVASTLYAWSKLECALKRSEKGCNHEQ